MSDNNDKEEILTFKINKENLKKAKEVAEIRRGKVVKESDGLIVFFEGRPLGYADGYFPEGYEFIYNLNEAIITASKTNGSWKIGDDKHIKETIKLHDIVSKGFFKEDEEES